MMIVVKVDVIPPLDGRIRYVVYNHDDATFGEHYDMIVNKYPRCLSSFFFKYTTATLMEDSA